MKLFIPACGYRIKLTQDWTFTLHHEHRNKTLFEALGDEFKWGGWRETMKRREATLAKGTLLEVDRVYIRTTNKGREGDDDYDSITFRILESPSWGDKKHPRFWVKLADANQLEYELPPDHTAGKSKKDEGPERLDADAIRGEMANALRAYRGSHFNNFVPPWMTVDLAKQLSEVRDEYQRLLKPVLDKTTSHYDPSWYFALERVTAEVMGGAVKFERKNGARSRVFRPRQPYHYHVRESPNLQHLFIRVHTDADDLNITRAEAGIGAP